MRVFVSPPEIKHGWQWQQEIPKLKGGLHWSSNSMEYFRHVRLPEGSISSTLGNNPKIIQNPLVYPFIIKYAH
jgi:hypothetical protein